MLGTQPIEVYTWTKRCIYMCPIINRYFTSLKAEDFEPYFSGRRKLLPRHSDLSFYNWDTNYSTSNSTINYQVRGVGGGRTKGRWGWRGAYTDGSKYGDEKQIGSGMKREWRWRELEGKEVKGGGGGDWVDGGTDSWKEGREEDRVG